MSTAAVSTSSIYQEVQAFYQQRGSDLQQLGKALQSGDLAGAQKEFAAIQTLGKSGPFASGDPFVSKQREQDFAAIGQSLQSGDLAAAQQAFVQLQSTFHQHHQQVTQPPPAIVVNLSGSNPASPAPASSVPALPAPAPPATSTSTGSQPAAGTSTAPAGGTEIVLNLGAVTPGEQITIGLNNTGNGTEQVTIGVASQANQAPEQITLNLNQNSNQQIILNLFNGTAASGTTQGSGVNATA
jgi:hypothetical protein